MADINNVTIGQIVTTISVVTVIAVFVGQINKWIKEKTKPIEEFKDNLDDMDDRITKIEDHQANDLESIQDMKRCIRLLLRSNMALLANGEDNNHTGQLKQMEKEIQQYLIDNS